MLVNTIKYVKKKNPHFGLLIYINKKGEGMKMGCVECGENWCGLVIIHKKLVNETEKTWIGKIHQITIYILRQLCGSFKKISYMMWDIRDTHIKAKWL